MCQKLARFFRMNFKPLYVAIHLEGLYMYVIVGILSNDVDVSVDININLFLQFCCQIDGTALHKLSTKLHVYQRKKM